MLILQQSRNTALRIKRQADESHAKIIDTPNSLLDTSLHSRKKRFSSTHQNAEASFPNQETLRTTHPTSPTGRNLHNKEEPQTTRIQKGHPKHSNLNKMKKQRNTQQVKEHDKCPRNQTKEEEIRSLPEKEFRIMIVKMIQNLEKKIELQINSLETRIKKMQEMFNKDLEVIKKSQYIMNNAINELKNTLEGTNSRLTEAEDKIGEVEDRMVEINKTETSGTMLKAPIFKS